MMQELLTKYHLPRFRKYPIKSFICFFFFENGVEKQFVTFCFAQFSYLLEYAEHMICNSREFPCHHGCEHFSHHYK